MEQVRKYPDPASVNEKERLEALKNYSIMDTLPEADFDALTRLASYICNTPVALISLLDADRQWFKSKVGLEIDQTERELAFCKYTIQGQDIFEIPDTHKSELVNTNPLVTGDPNIRFYAGAPLTTPDGYNLGALCVIDTIPKNLSEQQKEALQTLARQVVSNLELRLQKRKLEEENQRLEKYQMWFKHTKELMCMVDAPTCIFEDINPSFSTTLGYEPHEIIGKSLSKIVYREDWTSTMETVAKGVQENLELIEIENRIVCKDGSLRWFSWHAISKGGKWYADGRDITESKNLKTLLQSTESMANVGGWEYDTVTKQLSWTEQIYHIHELPLDFKINLEKAIGFYLPEAIPVLENAIERVITSQETFDIELPFITAKGTHKWVRSIGRPVVEHNKVVKMRGSFQDITQKRAIEAQQKVLFGRLEKSNSELQQKERYLKEINQLATLLLNRSESEEIAWEVPTSILKELAITTCAIYLIDKKRQNLVQKAVYTANGLETISKNTPLHIPLGKGIVGTVGITGIPEVINDLTKDPRCEKYPEGFYSNIAIPIIADGMVLGVICAKHARKDFFTSQHLEILSTVANLVASSVKNAMNVHKKKVTEQALRESEAQTRLIIDTALDAVIITNSEGVITNWNSQATQVFGWSKNEAISKSLSELIIPEPYREAHEQGLKHYLNTGEHAILNKRIEVTAMRKNGEEFPLELTVSPVQLEKGMFFSAFARDISEKNKAKKELEFISSRLMALIQNLQAGVMVEDDNRNIVIVNQPFCDIFSNENLVGINYTQSIDSIKHLFKDPDAFARRIPQLIEKKQVCIGENIEMVNGKCYARDFIPIFSKDKYLGHLWQYNDVTERKNAEKKLKESEEKYRSIIEHMKLGVLELDMEEKITYAYDRFYQMTGYAAGELTGKHISELLPAAYQYIFHLKNALCLEGQSGVYEIQLRKKSGELMWALVSGAPLYDNYQQVTGSIGIHLDITEQKNIEADLLQERRKAEESSKAKENFLANMSHEIRTPMNAIIGMSNLIAQTPLTSKQNSYINAIKTSSNNLLVIINDILDFSKIESGKLTLENIGFKPEDLIHSLIQSISYKAEEKGVAISTSIDSRISQVIIGDPVRVNQVLLNLVNNAIKFTSEGYVELQCNLAGESSDRQIIEFKVIDTGIGISQHKLHSIYDSFSQEDESITRRFGGTGLGLTICKQIAELMGGSIQVESEKGKGSTFSFCVSFAKGTPGDLILTKEEKRNVNLHGIKVLLAEDHDINRLLAISILHEWNVRVDIAENGQIALEKAKTNAYDIILMDMQMPVMSGIEATMLIRSELKLTIPILALTANAGKSDFEKCIKAGMNDYISKPFNPVILFNKMAELLNIQVEEKEQSIPAAAIYTNEKLFNLSRLQNMANGNEGFVQNMITLFRERTPGSLLQLNNHFEQNRLDKVAIIAHQLKPSIDFMGIEELTTEIRLLEKCNEKNLADVQDSIEKLNRVLGIVFIQLENQNTK